MKSKAQGHDRWNMSGRAKGAGAHKPKSEKRKANKLRKQLMDY